jgi:hypothetical protein
MARKIVSNSNDLLIGVDVASEGDTGSPDSGGASPYLRRGGAKRYPVRSSEA